MTTVKTSVVHCWLRELREDGSKHRVGCVALRKVGLSIVSAFTLCAPVDKFDPKHAKRLALRRLKFKTKVHTIDTESVEKAKREGSPIFFNELIGLSDKTIAKHMAEGRVYAEVENCTTLAGAVHNLLA